MDWLRDHRVLGGLTAAYVVVLGVLVVGPWGWELNRLTVWLYSRLRYGWPIAPDWVRPEDYGWLLNVLLFVPAAALLALVTRWAWWRIVLGAAIGSGLIELAQWTWLPRDGGWADVRANTLGAVIGVAAVSLLARRGSRRAGRPGSPRRT